jgi:alpha-1,3-rhamnosyl/mannosyltransferase
LHQATRVITGTAAVRDEIVNLLGISAEQISLVPYGIRSELRPASVEQRAAIRRSFELPELYLLNVGTIEPRKNLLMLLRAYCRLPAALRERCPLVLAGGWGWNAADVAGYYEKEARHRGVRQIGYVHDQELAGLYSAAQALVFPSLYEGYGLPPLEMLACGGRVLAGDLPAVREVIGAHAWLLDPGDEEAWFKALKAVMAGETPREDSRTGMEHARQFTWERCARETVRVYEAALGVSTDQAAPTKARSSMPSHSRSFFSESTNPALR